MKRLFFVILIWLFAQSAFAATGVWYACDANGTSDNLENPATNITISGGVATLTEQTGNIGAGMNITYDTDHHAYIAPNRLGFDAGKYEIEQGDKIEDATSGGTGIVRYVEIVSGSWAGNDTAGYIYFESTEGTAFGNNNVINIVKPTAQSGAATVDGTIQGNIGSGNTEFVVKAANGTDASDYGPVAVDSIKADYGSLSALEAGFEDSNHLNGSLTATDTVLFATCYTRGAPDTTAMIIDFTSSGADNYFQVFTPTGGAESIASQRHDGKWDEEKCRLEVTGDDSLYIAENYASVDGLQISSDGDANDEDCIYISSQTSSNEIKISNCILKSLDVDGTYYCNGLHVYDTEANLIAWNLICYGFVKGLYSNGIRIHTCSTAKIYSSTIQNCRNGIDGQGGTIDVYNCAVFNNTDDFYHTAFDNISFCASDDGDGTHAVTPSNWSAVFVDYANGNFHLKSTDTDLKDAGTDLSSEGLWRDIDGDTRSGTWDIGADEHVSSGPPPTFCVPMFSTDGIHSLIFGGQVIK